MRRYWLYATYLTAITLALIGWIWLVYSVISWAVWG
jgi:hypothetical protein